MNKEQLIEHLNFHLRNSQKSERWSMYRLIVPVIDFANENTRFTIYFEYNQTSSHETSQSVDIALLDRHNPEVMIEAKGLRRSVSAEQISKYLAAHEKLRGIVSNGHIWILCLNGKNKPIDIYPKNIISQIGIDEIVAFISGKELNTIDWSEEVIYYSSSVTPTSQIKKKKATRKSNEVTQINDLQEFKNQLESSKTLSELDKIFLKSISKIFEIYKDSADNLRCEFRSSRISFFCNSKEISDKFNLKRSKRIARIEFRKMQPDVLLLSNLVSLEPELSRVAVPTPHDKGPHMRRFRLKNREQTEAFGQLVSKLILKEFIAQK